MAHAFAVFVCLYREIKDVNVKRIGTLFKFLEVCGVYMFFAVIVLSLHHYSFWMYDFSVDSLKKFLFIDMHT